MKLVKYLYNQVIPITKIGLLSNNITCLLVIITLTISACDSEEAFDCIKKTGAIVEEQIATDTFDVLVVYDDIDVYLMQGDTQELILKAGQNLIPKIKIQNTDSQLIISNTNYCNWVRGYAKPALYIKGNLIKEIIHRGYGTIRSVDSLYMQSLKIDCDNATGDIFLDIHLKGVTIISNSLSNITLSGTADNLHVGYYYNHGKFDGQTLLAGNVTVLHHGVNSVSVYPIQKLEGELARNGDLVYWNKPDVLNVAVSGTGKLIEK